MDMNIQHRLQSLGDKVLFEFLHTCVDDICGKKVQSYNNFKSCTNWTNDDYDETYMTVKELLCHAAGRNLPEDKILQEVAELDASHQQCIIDCLEVRRGDISSALEQKSCRISGPSLVDFDWKLKWVMGNSKLSSLREPLLSVDFHVSEEKGSTNKTQSTISLELDRNELSKLLAALEKAQENINNWKT